MSTGKRKRIPGWLKQAHAAGRSALEGTVNRQRRCGELAAALQPLKLQLAGIITDPSFPRELNAQAFGLSMELLRLQEALEKIAHGGSLSRRASAGPAPGNESRSSQTVPPPAAAPSAAPAGSNLRASGGSPLSSAGRFLNRRDYTRATRAGFVSHGTVHSPARLTPAASVVTGFHGAADDFPDVDQNDAD